MESTRPGQGRRVKIDSIGGFIQDQGNRFDESAIEMMGEAIAKHLQNQGFADASVSALVEGGNTLNFELAIDKPAEEETAEPAPVTAATPASTEPAEAPAADDSGSNEAAVGDAASSETDDISTTGSEDLVEEKTAPEDQPEPSVEEPDPSVDGLPYIVDPFEVAYQYPHPDLPTVSSFMEKRFLLGYIDTEDGGRNWIGPRDGVTVIETSLNELNEGGGGVFWSSAIARVSSTISRTLIDDDLLGVFVILIRIRSAVSRVRLARIFVQRMRRN